MRFACKCLYMLDLRFAHTGQIGNLIKPSASDSLLLFFISKSKNRGVREIIGAGQYLYRLRLSQTFRPFEDRDLIELATGLARSARSRDKPQPADLAI